MSSINNLNSKKVLYFVYDLKRDNCFSVKIVYRATVYSVLKKTTYAQFSTNSDMLTEKKDFQKLWV